MATLCISWPPTESDEEERMTLYMCGRPPIQGTVQEKLTEQIFNFLEENIFRIYIEFGKKKINYNATAIEKLCCDTN